MEPNMFRRLQRVSFMEYQVQLSQVGRKLRKYHRTFIKQPVKRYMNMYHHKFRKKLDKPSKALSKVLKI